MKNDANLVYDIDGLVAEAKKNLRNSIIKISVAAVVLTLSILAIIFFGSYMLVFIGGVVLACVSAFMCYKLVRQISFADYSSTCGEIADVFKESTTVRSITGGYGMYVTRKYDAFAKAAIRLTVSLKNEDEVHSYVLEGVTEEHSNYYEAKVEAIHIWGTRFPVKLEIGNEKWLCPVCGEFNANKEKSCNRCKKKILN